MDDKNKTPGSLGLDDISPAAGPKGPGLGSSDFSLKDNGGPSMDPAEEQTEAKPVPSAAKNNMPPLGLVALLMAAGALVISLWALWTTPGAVVVADGANMQPIQAQIDNLSNRIAEFEVSPLGPPDKKSHTASISLLRRKVVSLSAKIDALEQDQRRLTQAQSAEAKAAQRQEDKPLPPARATSAPAIALAQTTPEPKATATATATPTPQPTKAPTSATEKITHTVRSGQTLSLISRRYNVTITAIKRWNGLRNNNIQVGQKLTIYVKH